MTPGVLEVDEEVLRKLVTRRDLEQAAQAAGVDLSVFSGEWSAVLDIFRLLFLVRLADAVGPEVRQALEEIDEALRAAVERQV